jgi:hypothetical protein
VGTPLCVIIVSSSSGSSINNMINLNNTYIFVIIRVAVYVYAAYTIHTVYIRIV